MTDTDLPSAEPPKISEAKRLAFTLIVWSLISLTTIGAYVFFDHLAQQKLEDYRSKLVVSIWQKDDLIAQSLKPNAESIHENNMGEFSVTIKTTSQGFRDIREYQIPKPKNTFRILMMGDSFTFGHGVEVDQTFSKVLEKSLNEKYKGTGTNFEVINAGYASGFTWDEYYLFLRERGLKYQPDLVVVNTWVGNDLTDLLEHKYTLNQSHTIIKIASLTNFVNKNSFLQTKPKSIPIRSGIAGFGDEIHSLCFLSALCKLAIWPQAEKIGSIIFPQPTVENLQIQQLGSMMYTVDFLRARLSPDLTTAWNLGKRLLLATKKIAVNAGTRFMINNIPVKFEVYDVDSSILGDKNLANENRLETFAHENAIPYCSALAELKQQPETSYFTYDSHLTATGHRIVAEAIQDCLSSLLPQLPQ